MSFYQALVSSHDLVLTVEPFCARTFRRNTGDTLHPSQARRVVALSFLAMVAAWEEYLEAVFVRYLAGAKTSRGYAPSLRAGTAADLDHSYQLITGKRDFDPNRDVLPWSSPTVVIQRAEIFFYQGQPFKGALTKYCKQLQDAAVIRNRVAHASAKCRTEFKKIALQHLGRPSNGKLSQGFSAGDLLLNTGQRGFKASSPSEAYFLHYWQMYLDLAGHLMRP